MEINQEVTWMLELTDKAVEKAIMTGFHMFRCIRMFLIL